MRTTVLSYELGADSTAIRPRRVQPYREHLSGNPKVPGGHHGPLGWRVHRKPGRCCQRNPPRVAWQGRCEFWQRDRLTSR